MKYLKARRLMQVIKNYMADIYGLAVFTGMNIERRLNNEEEYTIEEFKSAGSMDLWKKKFISDFEEDQEKKILEVIASQEE